MFSLFGRKAGGKIRGKLPFQVDVHAHVLPGIDDGAKNLEISVELIKRLSTLGIKKIIATPHVTSGSFPNTDETIGNAFRTLTDTLKHENIEMEVVYSAEYRLDDLFEQIEEEKKLLPFPQNYILIENPFIQPYPGIDDLIPRLQEEGYKPLIAHIERYSYYNIDRKKVLSFREQGCFFQVNILSLSGYYGPSAKEFALWLLQEEMIDFLGTDVHNIRQIDILQEYINSRAYEKTYPFLIKNPLKNDTLLDTDS